MHRGCNAHAAAEALESEDHTKGAVQAAAMHRLDDGMRACVPRMHSLVGQAAKQGVRDVGKQGSMQHALLKFSKLHWSSSRVSS